MKKRAVSELMNPDVVCVRPGMTVKEVEQLLASRGVSGAPVVDDAGHILGVVSQSDLVRRRSTRVTAGESGRFFTDDDEYRDIASLPIDASQTPVEEVMHKEVYSVTRDTGVAVAANIMRERRIHRLLVTEKDCLVGVISSLDLMRVVEEAI
jgi:CBS domain-containing protein